MSSSTSIASDDGRAFPKLKLCLKPVGVDVTPTVSPTDRPDAATVPLCQIPKSLADSLTTACLWFWRRHHRCVGIVLLLDPVRQSWTAVIPAQRSSADSACWSAARRDIPGTDPDTAIAGSFQSRVLAPGEELADCPPPHDGVHIVMSVGGETVGLAAFLRCGGVTRPVPPQDVLFDDLELMFLAAADRIVLA
jgi:hypothetical protein